jgi:thiol-disulfide isomerase/thioredoxin
VALTLPTDYDVMTPLREVVMSDIRKRSWRVGVVVLVALALVPVLCASGLIERDQRRLERAKEAHAQEIERALEIYATRVQRANDALERVYVPLITRYEQRGEQAVADDLRRELDELTASAWDLDGDLIGNSEGQDGSYEELIEAIGPVLVDARGRTIASSALQEANYVVLLFSAQWCGLCRQFTPHLMDFHQQHSQRHRVAVIYISSDRSADQMMQYMDSSNMPWQAVPYGRVDDSGLKRKYNARGGIPNVVVLNREGEIVLRSSYPDMPPLQLLDALAKQL